MSDSAFTDWLASDSWQDYKQQRAIREIESSLDGQRAESRALRSQLSRLQGSMEQRLTRLISSFDAFVELSDLRAGLAGFDEAARARYRARQVLAFRAGAAPGLPAAVEDVEDYWLAPAAAGLAALARGADPGADLDRAAARDPRRTALLLLMSGGRHRRALGRPGLSGAPRRHPGHRGRAGGVDGRRRRAPRRGRPGPGRGPADRAGRRARGGAPGRPRAVGVRAHPEPADDGAGDRADQLHRPRGRRRADRRGPPRRAARLGHRRSRPGGTGGIGGRVPGRSGGVAARAGRRGQRRGGPDPAAHRRAAGRHRRPGAHAHGPLGRSGRAAADPPGGRRVRRCAGAARPGPPGTAAAPARRRRGPAGGGRRPGPRGADRHRGAPPGPGAPERPGPGRRAGAVQGRGRALSPPPSNVWLRYAWFAGAALLLLLALPSPFGLAVVLVVVALVLAFLGVRRIYADRGEVAVQQARLRTARERADQAVEQERQALVTVGRRLDEARRKAPEDLAAIRAALAG